MDPLTLILRLLFMAFLLWFLWALLCWSLLGRFSAWRARRTEQSGHQQQPYPPEQRPLMRLVLPTASTTAELEAARQEEANERRMKQHRANQAVREQYSER